MNTSKIVKLIIAISLPLLLGAIAGIFTSQNVTEWYATLNQPSFNPPNWVFGPVWTILYILMGISFYLIWQLPLSSERNRALVVYGVQLLLNFAWTFFFFYFKTIGFALVDIILLWFCIVYMLIAFYKTKPIAAYLNFLYLLWVSFAMILNLAYFLLN